MSKEDKNPTQEELDKEEMTVDLELDDGSHVTCAVVTILTVAGKDYIALLPLAEDGENTDGEVWFYRYSENPKHQIYFCVQSHVVSSDLRFRHCTQQSSREWH